MTEEEAKTKWCCGPEGCGRQKGQWAMPATPVGMSPAHTQERWFSDGPRTCIGSACMAWRWHELPSAGAVRPEGQVTWMSNSNSTWAVEPARPSYVGDGWHWDSQRGLWIVGEHFEDRGYCGLAGTP